jgi:hypothetical protein
MADNCELGMRGADAVRSFPFGAGSGACRGPRRPLPTRAGVGDVRVGVAVSSRLRVRAGSASDGARDDRAGLADRPAVNGVPKDDRVEAVAQR